MQSLKAGLIIEPAIQPGIIVERSRFGIEGPHRLSNQRHKFILIFDERQSANGNGDRQFSIWRKCVYWDVNGAHYGKWIGIDQNFDLAIVAGNKESLNNVDQLIMKAFRLFPN